MIFLDILGELKLTRLDICKFSGTETHTLKVVYFQCHEAHLRTVKKSMLFIEMAETRCVKGYVRQYLLYSCKMCERLCTCTFRLIEVHSFGNKSHFHGCFCV